MKLYNKNDIFLNSKKIISIILIIIFSILTAILPNTNVGAIEFSYPLGDANLDGRITILDVTYI